MVAIALSLPAYPSRHPLSLANMRSAIPTYGEAGYEEYARIFDRLQRSAILLDAQHRLPHTRIFVGWDPIIGLVPVLGDIVAAALSIRIIRWAYLLGADTRLIWRMVLNATVDAVLGAVPIVGTLFDVWFRANVRNLRLLVDDIEAHRLKATDGAA